MKATCLGLRPLLLLFPAGTASPVAGFGAAVEGGTPAPSLLFPVFCARFAAARVVLGGSAAKVGALISATFLNLCGSHKSPLCVRNEWPQGAEIPLPAFAHYNLLCMHCCIQSCLEGLSREDKRVPVRQLIFISGSWEGPI